MKPTVEKATRGSISKRLLDVSVSLALLIVLAPLLAVIAILIRLYLGAPVFFRQERVGLGARPFVMIKFRTMSNECDAEGIALPDEQRIGRLGSALRATSLDELPELWNVLTGDMSLVGPRPLLVEYLPLYSDEQRRRHEVCPGITGWAQVNGRNSLSWPERLAMDVWYVDNHSLLLDLRILAMTISRVLGRKGISGEGHATMPKFTGEHE